MRLEAVSRQPPAVGPVGVLDWGIGGFGVVRLFPPGTAYTYLSDSGFPPYGTVPTAALRRRIEQVGRWFAARGVTHLVVACNAASTVVPSARFPADLRVTDVVTHGVRAALASRGTIGVVGGIRTIRSRAYTRPLAAAGRVVRGRVAQPLSARIERGELDGPALEEDLRRILRPLRVDTLVLGCTHYPAIVAAFSRATDAALVDPAEALVEAVRADLGAGPSASFTTGDPAATAAAARAAFGVAVSPRKLAMGLETRDDRAT